MKNRYSLRINFVILFIFALFVVLITDLIESKIITRDSSQVEVNFGGGRTSLADTSPVTDEITNEKNAAFIYWDGKILFSLPNFVYNSDKVILEFQFKLRSDPNMVNLIILFMIASALVLLLVFYRQNIIIYKKCVSALLRVVGSSIYILCVLVIIISFVYLFFVFAGWLNGYVLPNTALFRWFPDFNSIALHEPFFGHMLLVLALAGVAANWLSTTTGDNGLYFTIVEENIALGFRRYGLFFLLSLFLYSVGATWAGIPRPQDLGGNAIAGLVPFSDANGHFQYVYMQAMQGEWDPFVARRPLAAAFRTVLVAAVDFNNFHFLMLQTVGLAGATFFAARAVVNWRGIWAGLTFLGLTCIIVRPYLPTNLTEPLGLFWALVSIPFFVSAFQRSRVFDGVISFHFTLWALMTRMGSMFTIPFLALWVVFSHWKDGRNVVRSSLLVALIVVINVALFAGMVKLYGSVGGATGSNFSHVICGLTHGTDWTGCGVLYAEQVQLLPTEAGKASFFYARAWEKFVAEPYILFARLIQGEVYFLLKIWQKILVGYTGEGPEWFPVVLWWLVVILGVLWVARSRLDNNEILFWQLFLIGLFASAPFVIFDDGWRVLSGSFPLIALLLSLGFTSPAFKAKKLPKQHEKFKNQVYCFFIISIAALCIAVPGLVHRQDWLRKDQIVQPSLAQDQDIFLGTRYMSGFLVMPDGAPLTTRMPAVYFSDFVEIVRLSSVEQYDRLVTPISVCQPPFAIVSAISVTGKSQELLIMPAEVFQRLDGQPWLFRLSEGNYWRYVVETTSLSR